MLTFYIFFHREKGFRNLKSYFHCILFQGESRAIARKKMNIIRNAGNKRMSTIAGEMINFEVGKRLFVNGVYTIPPHEPIYGSISIDGVKLLIKPTFGFLFIDQRTLTSDELSYGDATDSNLERWTKLLAKKIQDIDGAVTAAEMTKYGRKMAYFPLETGEDGFTSTKMRSKTFDTKYIREGTKINKNNLDRAIVYGGQMASSSVNEYFGIARFTWVIYPFERLLNGIAEAASHPQVDKALLGYFSFVYDPNFIIKPTGSFGSAQNGGNIEITGRELKLTDLSCVNEIMPIYSGGLLKLEDIINMSNKDTKNQDSASQGSQDSSPSSPGEEALSPGTLAGSISTSMTRYISIIGMEQLMRALKKTPIEVLRFPGYVPGISNIMLGYRITYCPKRFGAIEIMRQFGITFNENVVSNIFPIRAISTQVFEIKYADVIIDNVTAPNDVCGKCRTPLYDSIYLIYALQQDKKSTAYCQICMHSVFDVSGGIVHGTDLYDAHTLYQGSAVLAKTLYPRTVNQVIDMIPNDQVREIVRSFYSKNNTPVAMLSSGQASGESLLFINCTATSNKAKSLLDSKIYIGVQKIATYLEYCFGSCEASPSAQEFLGTHASVIYQNSILFPISIVHS